MESYELPDLIVLAQIAARNNGCPNIRQVAVTSDTACQDFSPWVEEFAEELTRPLTRGEAADGVYAPVIPPRIAMTGTYEEIVEYFEGDDVWHCSGGPYSEMTVGLPIVLPTEARVAAMLKGTSHSPDEVLEFGRGKYTATIEKIAVNAVMAGCKPEYFPVVLAIAESGACVGYGGDSSFGHLHVVSGPIAKEIGMNSGFAYLALGNRANESLQHACGLIGVNCGMCDFGINMLERTSGAWGQTWAEHPKALLEDTWDPLNVQYGYEADESVLLAWGRKVHLNPFQNIEVKNAETLEHNQPGTPEHIVAALKTLTNVYGAIVAFTPDTARYYKERFGFETADELQEYLWDNCTWPAGDWYKNYWFTTHGHARRVRPPTPGEKRISTDHLGLPDDAQVPLFWEPDSIVIVVAGGTGDAWTWGGSGAGPGTCGPRVISIDDWK